MTVKTVQDLFLEELRDIYHAEKQITKALPKMAKAATHPELKQAFELHLEQTKGQIERLEQVFDQLDTAKRGKRCEAMEGLLEEARSTMEEIEDKNVLDVGMIVNAQKVEHYEIAGYGSLVALAKQLGQDEVASLLEQTLKEEKETDQKLNQVALSVANPNATSGTTGTDGTLARTLGGAKSGLSAPSGGESSVCI
jgi:ferritin-like metal-binding protein YciE